jgi:hypothetical protein
MAASGLKSNESAGEVMRECCDLLLVAVTDLDLLCRCI